MKKVRLLLADDHQIVLDGIQAFLAAEPGLEIAGCARSGEEALLLLERQTVDVLVLDINMPGLDGIETAKLVRRRHPATRIILLTMTGDGHFILNALRLGIHGYVIKEKSKETLVTAIHCVAGGSRYFSPDLLDRIDFSNQAKDEQDEVQLTRRETEILCLMAEEPSFTAKEVADRLNIAKTTVEKHIYNIKEKLDLHRNMELIKYALEKKLCT